MNASLAEHFFRHEYGRLVAMLVRRFGVRHLEEIEDAVQSSLLAAAESWPRSVVPDNPSAWLYRVAYHQVVGELRQGARCKGQSEERPSASTDWLRDTPEVSLSGDVRDDLLRMLFVCCDESLPVESQLVLALRTLCGFDVREISDRLFMTQANVYKRLSRARARLREAALRDVDLTNEQLEARLAGVLGVLYTLFTEGYLSGHPDGALRRELCDEARRLTAVLAEHPVGARPETFALLALMFLHEARMGARQDDCAGLLLLEEQDRRLWDQGAIQTGLSWLARAATGQVFSRYHAEAGIAAEHCLAPTLAETRWDRIIACCELLEQLAPSPLHTLTRALAVAEWRGPDEGLAILDQLAPPSWLRGSYHWPAVLADLNRRAGRVEVAARLREAALASAPGEPIRQALARRLGAPP